MTNDNFAASSSPTPLLDNVIDALSTELDISSEQIFSFHNSEKYSSNAENADFHTLDIFHKLREINQIGINEKDLCRSDDGNGYSFREGLDKSISELSYRLKNKKIIYIELGPEPVKTELILNGIMNTAELAAYICIDINASSKNFMLQHISKLIGDSKVTYLLSDYRDISRSQILDIIGQEYKDCTFVITSLGSQEGNEHPEVMHSVYRSLMDKGDLLLSEMQILPTYNHHPIFAFSHHPLWKAVSKSHVSRMMGDFPSNYGTVMVSLNLNDIGSVKCAIAVESIKKNETENLFLSNYCLKYKLEQIRELRTQYGYSITNEIITGDGSVLFHTLTLASIQ